MGETIVTCKLFPYRQEYTPLATVKGMKARNMVLGILLLAIPGFQNASAQSTNSLQDSVHCRVVCETARKGGSTVYADKEVSVATNDLDSLSATPPETKKPMACPFGLGDFHGKLVNQVHTEHGVLIETYEGDFTSVVADEKYSPRGEKEILNPVLKPGAYWPAGSTNTPEMLTAELPSKKLRALWWRPPQFGSNLPFSRQYFAVSVQFYERSHAIRRAVFTGRKTVKNDAFIFKNKTVVDLKGAQIQVNDTEWQLDEGVTLDCVPFRFNELAELLHQHGN